MFADEEVKFGVENDLSSDRCHQLLKKYMSEHIRSSKITQRLFVKYVTCCSKSVMMTIIEHAIALSNNNRHDR